ncbi:MAG: hypothetical protein NTW33_01835 [Methanoregula sp.]|nr:hypothetical protein [Methanoregula sp.]
MSTVFSHIVQKQFSKQYENVATEALAFILHSNDSARNGMIRLLRGIAPDMPDLHFRTQQTEGSTRPDSTRPDSTRPDMRGDDDENEPRVFIENKFWAGLTDNQPRTYLELLAEYPQTSILLVVVPNEREQTMWLELSRRLKDAGIGISAKKMDTTSGSIVYSVKTKMGPYLALTSWTRLISTLELEVADDPSARSDLLQLKALCEAADSDEFKPISAERVSDQRIPAFILQLTTIVQDSIDSAANEDILKLDGLRASVSSARIGRYVKFRGRRKIGAFWLGIHFSLWKLHGRTPFWLVSSKHQWGLPDVVWPLLKPWAAKEGVFAIFENDELVVAIDLAFGEDKDEVVRRVVDRLNEIAKVLK